MKLRILSFSAEYFLKALMMISHGRTQRCLGENLIFGRKKGSRRVRDHNEFVICYNVRWKSRRADRLI